MSDFRKLFLAAVAAILLATPSVAQTANAQTRIDAIQEEGGVVSTTIAFGDNDVATPVSSPDKNGEKEAAIRSPFPFAVAVQVGQWESYATGFKVQVVARPLIAAFVSTFTAQVEQNRGGVWYTAQAGSGVYNVYVGHAIPVVWSGMLQDGLYRVRVNTNGSPEIVSYFTVGNASMPASGLYVTGTTSAGLLAILTGNFPAGKTDVVSVWRPGGIGNTFGAPVGYYSWPGNTAYISPLYVFGAGRALARVELPYQASQPGNQLFSWHITVCQGGVKEIVCSTRWDAVALTQ